jgi:hypothetical protein
MITKLYGYNIQDSDRLLVVGYLNEAIAGIRDLKKHTDFTGSVYEGLQEVQSNCESALRWIKVVE